MSVPRVVLDANCLISALIFSRGKFTWLREAWQARRFTPLTSRDTVSELLRVLAYPKFKLSHDEQETLLAEFLPYVETVKIETTPEGLPEIRDADDVIFLVLAAVAKADALVSGDGDIRAVKAQFKIPILSVAEFADWLLREAIEQYVTREEQREAFRQEALDAWNHYQATGLHATGAEADAWLAELEAGNDVEPPASHA